MLATYKEELNTQVQTLTHMLYGTDFDLTGRAPTQSLESLTARYEFKLYIVDKETV